MKLKIAIIAILLPLQAATLLAQVQTPTITSISPTYALAGSGSFTLFVNGTNFMPGTVTPGSTVRWNGLTVPTTYVSPTRLNASISASLVANAGTAGIDVLNISVPSNSVPFFIVTPLVISTADPLPSATVGIPYSVQFTATGGDPPYLDWRLVEGEIPPGLTLNPDTGILSGTPVAVGNFILQIYVDDSRFQSATKVFNLAVNLPRLSITTDSLLPDGTVGVDYLLTFSATGGSGEYGWSLSSGSLPPGLALSRAGVLSGAPTESGSFVFRIRVTDSAQNTVVKQFTLAVEAPSVPALSITGLNDTEPPAGQPSFDVELSETYPLPVTGTMSLAFAPDAVHPADDPAIQFSAGGRTLDFTIAPGETSAFPDDLPALQTGTVAGEITLTVTGLSAAGESILPSPAPSRSVLIAQSAPVIASVEVVRTGSGFNLRIIGYSTPREITRAAFRFTAASGASLQTAQLTVPVADAFTEWYGGDSSAPFGSTFLYTQPFTVQGDIESIGSVGVTLSNSLGDSQAVSAAF